MDFSLFVIIFSLLVSSSCQPVPLTGSNSTNSTCSIEVRGLTRTELSQSLRRAADIIDGRPRSQTDTRLNLRVEEEAAQIVSNITGAETGLLANTDSSQPSSAEDFRNDPDFCDEGELILPDRKRRRITSGTLLELKNMIDQNRSERAIRARYGWYRRQYKKSIIDCANRGDSIKSKYEIINKYVADQFHQHFDINKRTTRDFMLRRWARIRAAEIGLTRFTASEFWLHSFKKKNKISSRKRTKNRSRAENAQNPLTLERIEQFRRHYGHIGRSFLPRLIWNMDQSGFNYEFTSDRTLARTGMRDVIVNVEDKNKISHSYTSQPMISRTGQLIGKLPLCLQEAGGGFGPVVTRDIRAMEERFRNVVTYASKSGMMNATLMDRWAEEVLIPVAREHIATINPEEERSLTPFNSRNDTEDIRCAREVYGESMRRCRSHDFFPNPVYPALCSRLARQVADETCHTVPKILLIIDCWPGQTGRGSQNMLNKLRHEGVKVMVIPPHTTARLQPLDVSFNRQAKIFVNRITFEAHSSDSIRNVTSRAGIINMQSLIWNQFAALAYRDYWIRGWRHTDPNWSDEELFGGEDDLEATNKIQFTFDPHEKCDVQSCDQYGFVQCSHCGKILCLEHFLDRVCFHENADEELETELFSSADNSASSSQDRPGPSRVNNELFNPEYLEDDGDDIDVDLITHPSLLRRIGQTSTTPAPTSNPRDELRKRNAE